MEREDSHAQRREWPISFRRTGLVRQDDQSSCKRLRMTDEGASLMLDVLKELITNQFDAAWCTLSASIDEYPEVIPLWASLSSGS